MIAISDFLAELRAAGVQLWLQNGRLRYRPAGALDKEHLAVLRERRDEVIATMLGEQPPPPATRPDAVPLSDQQKGMWFLEQMGLLGAAYNQTALHRITGDLDVAALRSAIADIMRRHEILRTAFPARDGIGVQVVDPPGDPRFTFLDVSDLPEPEQRTWLEGRKRLYAEHRFDISVAQNFLTELIRLSPAEHILVFRSYHLVLDGPSHANLYRELRALYRAHRTGTDAGLPELPLQYADYALWQHQRDGAGTQRHMDYWTRRLADAPHTFDLPTDRPRPATAELDGDTVEVPVPADVADGLRRLASREGATLFMVLLAAFHTLLYRWSGQSDVSVGMILDGRERPDVEANIGHFVNPVVLRADLAGRPTFTELLGRLRPRLLEAYEHRHAPFDRLVAELRPQRDLSVQPLFQVLFTYLRAEPFDLLDGLTVTPIEPDERKAMFDLTLFANDEESGRLSVGLEYRTALFERATVRRLAGYLVTLLGAVARTPDMAIDDLPLMSDAQWQEVLEDWNGPLATHEDLCLHQMVERQAAAAPDAVAAVFGERQLTYRQLNERANALAHLLRERGVGPDERVGIALPRSLDVLVANLAVLKAGGACVPIDPTYPAARRRLIAEDARLRLLIRSPGGEPGADGDAPELEVGPGSAATGPGNPVDPAHIAWVLYTSGSTGRPKGVAMSHRALLNQVRWQQRQGPGGRGRTLQWAALSFDIFYQEMLTTLAAGDTLVLVEEEVRHDFERLLDVIDTERVERVFMPFVALRGMAELAVRLDRFPRSLRAVLTAGEQLQTTPAIREFFTRLPECALFNQYGPIEVHLATSHRLGDDPARWPALPPIGRPFDNVRAYVLDSGLRPVPPGVTGELFVGGAALARGYLGRPELTAERFLPDPFGDGARMYRTGDQVRWNAAGQLEFVGRFDDQVKIRGFRVEVAEIESVLAGHPQVLECAVAAHRHGDGDRRLVAYVVPEPDRPPAAADLRAFLADRLPDYMVPPVYQTLEKLPYTPSGKLSRALLPRPDDATEWAGTSVYEPPGTPLEERIAAIWTEVLGVPRIGVRDNFFELGGHSLLAVAIVNRIADALGRTVPLRTLFEAPTVAGLVARLNEPEEA
ncbi:amino acid adenylation domain-containing protein [Streptomyces sp. FB2]|uniref:non-ribosomal peptide synthetase n=1 Tax=Streptomyces sp. FB2 TaxID=2902454 RepID=UPI001F468DD6|nr:non-ribosomal peptide synthetase [Streptomyces sp. FB2]MCF2535701.1 amino acid adenylation domain-containing protein [Streptomyces sp. FB2]